MTLLTQTNSAQPPTDSTFGSLLAETLLEMEAAEIMDFVPEDAVQRLALEAQQAVVSQTGRPLPQVGGHIYRLSTVTPAAQTSSQLDVRY